jgi:hypothetical protein
VVVELDGQQYEAHNFAKCVIHPAPLTTFGGPSLATSTTARCRWSRCSLARW